MEKELYTTEDGVELTLVPVRPVLIQAASLQVEDEFRDRDEPIDPPVYRFKDVSGEFMTAAHSVDEATGRNTLETEDKRETARNWDAWNRHQDALVRMAQATEERRIKVMYMLGIECVIPDEGWENQLRVAGIDVPDDPLERKFTYLWFIACSMYDKSILRQVMQVLNYTKMVGAEQRKTFREAVQSSMEARAREIVETALQRVGKVGKLVPDDEARRDEGSEGVEVDAEPVG